MPKETYYITTAIDYPNAKPHIGHAYEKIIADFYARWNTLRGKDVYYVTGTDEHGQKLEKAAAAQNKKPQQFVDEMVEHFKTMCTALNISNSTFIRTTDKKHVKTATEIWNTVFEKGLITKGEYKGLYCTGCEAFFTERDLVDGKCPNHNKPVEEVSEESYFFKLSKYQEFLKTHIIQHPGFIQPEAKRKEILNRLQEPLKDLSVSRTTFKWGITVPQDSKHVIYVWFDALINYLSGIAYPTSKYEKYWPANCHLIGKDIVWFHTVIWGAMLQAAGISLPKTVYVHGFLTVNGQKMSKSLGNVVDPVHLVNTYGADPLRYVLLREVPAGEDGDFSEHALIERNNSDLADALGNLLQRTSVLIHKNFNGNIPICGEITEREKQLEDEIPDLNHLNQFVDTYKWHHVVEHIWNYVNKCNKYINDTEPWKQKNNPERLGTILYTLVEHLRIISILAWPIIPESAEKILTQLGQERGTFKNAKFGTKTKGELTEAKILFTKLEQYEKNPFSKLNLKVGTITEVQQHPDADKLYVISIDLGAEKRQLVAGIKPWYQPDELTGKHVIVVTNLKPAKLRGIESQGMILAAEHEDSVKVVEAPQSKPGDQVIIDGVTPETTQITFDDFMKLTLTVNNKHATYDGKTLKTENEETVVDLPDGSTIR